MRVDAGLRAMPPDEVEKVANVVAQTFGRNGRVFDKRQRLRIASHGHREAEGRLSHVPDRLLGRRLNRAVAPHMEALGSKVRLQSLESTRQVFGPRAVELDAQERRRFA